MSYSDNECELCESEFLQESEDTALRTHYGEGYDEGYKFGEQEGYNRGLKFNTMDVRNAFPKENENRCYKYRIGYSEGYFQSYHPGFLKAKEELKKRRI
jgi:flagellar biosynthesis/type III secretory pathway protein FliH